MLKIRTPRWRLQVALAVLDCWPSLLNTAPRQTYKYAILCLILAVLPTMGSRENTMNTQNCSWLWSFSAFWAQQRTQMTYHVALGFRISPHSRPTGNTRSTQIWIDLGDSPQDGPNIRQIDPTCEFDVCFDPTMAPQGTCFHIAYTLGKIGKKLVGIRPD